MANPPYGHGQQPPGGWQPPPAPPAYPPQPQPGGYQPPAGPRYDNDKGFFGSLFDFSFDNFIATKLVKFLYVLSLILFSITAIGYLIAGLVGLGQGEGFGLLLIIAAPLIWLIGLILTRLYLELVIVMFKISEDIKDIRDSSGTR